MRDKISIREEILEKEMDIQSLTNRIERLEWEIETALVSSSILRDKSGVDVLVEQRLRAMSKLEYTMGELLDLRKDLL